MTDIPNKLDVITRDQALQRFNCAAGIMDTFEIRNKINELIFYLQAKEEASKGECSCECHGAKKSTPSPCKHCLIPPEHEENCCCYSYRMGIAPCQCGCHKND